MEKQDLYYIFNKIDKKGFVTTYDIQIITQKEYQRIKEDNFESIKGLLKDSNGKVMIFKNIVPEVTISLKLEIDKK